MADTVKISALPLVTSSSASDDIVIVQGGVTSRIHPNLTGGALTLPLRNANGNIAANGVVFPAAQSASADANTLDDYEESTWTPTIIGSVTPGVQTYGIQVGRQTKIGNCIFLFGYVSMTAKDAAMAGVVRIGGLTVACSSVVGAGMALRAYSGITLAAGHTQLLLDMNSGGSYISLRESGSGVAIVDLPVADLGAASVIAFSGVYMVD